MFASEWDYAKTTRPIFTKFDGKLVHGSRHQKPPQFGGNPDHVTLGLGLAHDKMRSGADLNSDNLRISRAYLRISDHCRVTIRVRILRFGSWLGSGSGLGLRLGLWLGYV